MAGYLLTPGLERFPYFQRFSVWCDAYRFLLKTDLETQQRKKQFQTQILACIALIVCPVLACVLLPILSSFLAIYVSDRLLTVGIVVTVGLTLLADFAVVTWTILLSIREQQFRNQKIGALLLDKKRMVEFSDANTRLPHKTKSVVDTTK